MSKKLNIRPTSSVYATYKRLSYQPWTAIAEFVDNSTQSFYDHKEELLGIKYSSGLLIEINYIESPEEGDRLEITDNAYGMEWEDFQRAVILDKPPVNRDGRNEFGMGLKTAACWFGSIWSVESTRYNSRNKYYTEINVDELGKYKVEEIDVQEGIVSPKDHFTKIVIKNLNKKIKGSRTIGKVKDLLSSIYREDIRSGLVKIYYNGTLLSFKEPPIYMETVNGMEKTWKKDVNFSIMHDGKELKVKGFVAIRIPGSVKEAGFTLMRRGRVIIGGSENTYRPNELFGDSNSYAWQRLYGEFHMDNWPVTQAKDGFDWHNSGLEEAFIEQLKDYTQDYRRKADDIRVREKIKTTDVVNDALNAFSNSRLLEDATVTISTTNTSTEIPIEQTEEEKNNPDVSLKVEHTTEPQPIEEQEVADVNNEGVIIDGGNTVEYTFKYKGQEYCFHIIMDLDHPNAHWLLVEPETSSDYTLTINMRHAFFKPLIEKKEFMPLMMKMAISMVLAEIESMMISPDGKIDPSAIRMKMNEILETVGNGE